MTKDIWTKVIYRFTVLFKTLLALGMVMQPAFAMAISDEQASELLFYLFIFGVLIPLVLLTLAASAMLMLLRRRPLSVGRVLYIALSLMLPLLYELFLLQETDFAGLSFSLYAIALLIAVLIQQFGGRKAALVCLLIVLAIMVFPVVLDYLWEVTAVLLVVAIYLIFRHRRDSQ